jgi:hypothetical protein
MKTTRKIIINGLLLISMLISLWTPAFADAPPTQTWTGWLIDYDCVGANPKTHTQNCNLMPTCITSGLGIQINNGSTPGDWFPFDAASQALANQLNLILSDPADHEKYLTKYPNQIPTIRVNGYTATTGLPSGITDYTTGIHITSIEFYYISGVSNYEVTSPENVVLTETPSVTVPDAPTAVSAAAGDSQATVSFTAPASDGGSQITTYSALTYSGGVLQPNTATSTGSPITVTGLTNGTGYTFTVKAANAAGYGAASEASAAVTPVALLYITTASLPDGTAGSAYSLALAASGGTAPYIWSAPDLPANLGIDPASGAISGTPSATGTSIIHITVTDHNTNSTGAALQLKVNDPGLLVPPVLTAAVTNFETGSAKAFTTTPTSSKAINISFTDNPDWRAKITEVTVNGKSISGLHEITASGTSGALVLKAGVFSVSGNYNVTIKAPGYNDAAVEQKWIVFTVDGDDVSGTRTYNLDELKAISDTTISSNSGIALKDLLNTLSVADTSLVSVKTTDNYNITPVTAATIKYPANNYLLAYRLNGVPKKMLLQAK